jgi:hypothetical protein
MLSIVPLPYRILGYLAIIAGAFFVGYTKGLTHEQKREQADVLAQVVNVARVKDKQAKITAKSDQAHQASAEKIRTVYKTIINEVPTHVQESDRSCILSAGWVREYNAAAMSIPPDPASQSDASPSGVNAVDAIENAIGNYETCNQTRQQLIDLQAWIMEQWKVISDGHTR